LGRVCVGSKLSVERVVELVLVVVF